MMKEFATKIFTARNGYIVIGICALALLFELGFLARGCRPAEVREVEKVVYKDKVVEKIVTQIEYIKVKEEKKKIRKTSTVNEKPGGETTTVIVEEEDTETKENEQTKQLVYLDRVVEKWQEKIIEKRTLSQPGWSVGVDGGINVPYYLGGGSTGLTSYLNGAVIGLHADRRLFGPLWLGVRGDTTGTLSLSLSATW